MATWLTLEEAGELPGQVHDLETRPRGQYSRAPSGLEARLNVVGYVSRVAGENHE